ncbi:hypothetical protein EZ428_01135 [Pedobacter frigiditerrae]|uniref:MG2 domain-containing protein n=1 Tax=Pedobacter frigiditerrae TaxID=2530452 RepID=A0A4V2MJA1_9SPHI|nr:hypothetical protein EZ428_01135 [Pedobacter frigiditerrae]
MSNKIDVFNKILPVEKLYLSFDKPYYNVGDTVWFKSFLLNGNHTLNDRTDKIYIELFNDSLNFVENRVIALNNGLGYGDFALKNNLKEGSYTIRAYSNWQQNFGNNYFFQKSFYVGKANEKTWLLDSYQKLNTSSAKKTLDLKIRITNIKNEAAGLKDVEVYLMNDKKRLMRADLQTSINGTIETQIPMGENKLNGKYSFIIIDKKDKTRTSTLPILLQDVDQLDLQFMPEGGFMVNDIFGKVAFKAIGADGLGKDITGKIVNSKNETIAELKPTHKGMGSFYLMTKKGENYFAVYNLSGKEQKQMLPLAKEDGTTLRIEPFSTKDSIYIYIKASEQKRLENYTLTAQAGDENILTTVLNLKNGFSTLKLPKKDFPDGIIHFTLFSQEQQPLNERQAFINRNQKIKISVEPNKNSFEQKDSIAIEITTKKEDGSPLSGSFSIAVTDDGQVKQTLNEDNIISYFLLQSNVRGLIEDPSWYFNDEETHTLQALDHLLLTQAWVGYNWDKILSQAHNPTYKAEKGNVIEGRLTNLVKKPVPNINLTLLSLGRNILVMDTISNADGKFLFKDLPLLDSVSYTIKIKNAKGKTSTANLALDEFKPAADITTINPIRPWYVNSDSVTLNYYKHSGIVNRKTPERLQLEGNMLKEVIIKGQAKREEFMQTSAWDANLKLKIDEEELKKNPRKSLMDLLKEKIDGFTIGTMWAGQCGGRTVRHDFTNFLVGGNLISHVVVDNVNTLALTQYIEDNYNETGVSKTSKYPDVFGVNNYIFNKLSAQDIVEINIYKGCAYYFLDIKTRSGKGPWIITADGVYVFRPLPLYIAKDFYSPKYAAGKNSLTDYRSTIYWDANVVTDENGKAKISFYAADKPSTYTVKIEGADLFGRFGYQKSNIKIVNKTESK